MYFGYLTHDIEWCTSFNCNDRWSNTFGILRMILTNPLLVELCCALPLHQLVNHRLPSVLPQNWFLFSVMSSVQLSFLVYALFSIWVFSSVLLLLSLPDYGNFIDIFFLFRVDERPVWDLLLLHSWAWLDSVVRHRQSKLKRKCLPWQHLQGRNNERLCCITHKCYSW